ncbi:nitrous oxide-stimulated promoter family protein [Olsenella sp. Marseille-P4559]|uniref:nitrous oxide-stimulated promoter family protein n=1 Tax=Olsenella sp. Marseille-P4559 TaxID=2364795 RepID=UPI0010321299|nr:nitrous oxide-stimulated promoter family protein [Olsenella sp. Marseille-P4559]
MTRTEDQADRKRIRESRVMRETISLYCRGVHHAARGSLCPECEALASYAQSRIAHCPFMRTKTFCSACSVHCYAPAQQEQVRLVMRYAGLRLLFRHPVMCLHHGVDTLGAKLRPRGKAEA